MFNEYIHAFITEKPTDTFLFNRDYLKEFNRKSGNPRKVVPGYFYAMKITIEIELHYRTEELHMQFIKILAWKRKISVLGAKRPNRLALD